MRPPITLAGRHFRNDESQFTDNTGALKFSDVWSGNDSTMFLFSVISTVVLGVPVTWISLGPVHLGSWSVSLILVLLLVHSAGHSSLLGGSRKKEMNSNHPSRHDGFYGSSKTFKQQTVVGINPPETRVGDDVQICTEVQIMHATLWL